jgi:regulator of protease activity HflC (stomatin/prohibitin superfamily)
MLVGILLIVVMGVLTLRSIKVLRGDERGIVYRLGRPMPGVRGPGLVMVMPSIDKLVRISLGEQTVTAKNVTVRFRILDPVRALSGVADYREAIVSLADNTAGFAAEVKSKIAEPAKALGIEILDVTRRT